MYHGTSGSYPSDLQYSPGQKSSSGKLQTSAILATDSGRMTGQPEVVLANSDSRDYFRLADCPGPTSRWPDGRLPDCHDTTKITAMVITPSPSVTFPDSTHSAHSAFHSSTNLRLANGINTHSSNPITKFRLARWLLIIWLLKQTASSRGADSVFAQHLVLC